MPKVSIIIPVYNSSSTISRALISIFNQTYNDYEVVIVDDGSTDDLQRTLEVYEGKYRLFSQSNAGASAARNFGVKHAVGEFIAFLDADDYWHPDKLRLQIEVFERVPHIALCVTRGIKVKEKDVSQSSCFESIDSPRIQLISNFTEIFLNPYFGTPGVMMPRRLFEEVGGFDESLNTAEDIDLWLRVAYGRSVARIDYPLFYAVSRPLSLTSRQSDNTFRDNLIVVEHFISNHKSFQENSEVPIRIVKSLILQRWGSSLLSRREVSLAYKKLKTSLYYRINIRTIYLLIKAIFYLVTGKKY